MFRVLLIHSPFADVNRPSIGLSLLKAGLQRRGIACHVLYLNLEFAADIGLEKYDKIDRFNWAPRLGDWIFAKALFEGGTSDEFVYYDEVLKPILTSPAKDSDLAAAPIFNAESMVSGLAGLRRRAETFINASLSAHDWERYDLIGFTTTFQQSTAALALAKRVKQQHPSLLIAFGGGNCEGRMGVAMLRLFSFVDIVCSGEGDIAFVELAAALAAGQIPPPIDGIIHRLNGDIEAPATLAYPVRDMDALPIPDYTDYFAQRRQLGMDFSRNLTLPIESSRGCWWGQKAHCTFCGLNGGTMAFRTKSADRFLNEVEEMLRYGLSNFDAVDNIIDFRYFDSVLPRLAEKKLGAKFFYETKANLRRDQVRLLRESGVVRIQPGIESLSTAVLKRMRKGVQAHQNIRLLRHCAEFLVQPIWNLLGGFPGEEPVHYKEQSELVPLLMHLAPPGYVGSVRLDRFSPLFDQESFGLKNIRPAAVYRHIFPFDGDNMMDLAYFFDFEYPDARDPDIYMHELREAVTNWQYHRVIDQLIYLDDGETLTIRDGRAVRTAQRHELRGLDRLVYVQCEDGASASAVARELSDVLPDADGGCVEDTLRRLVSDKLVVEVDNHYLALAIDGEYRIRQLARCLAEESEVPADLRQAVHRLLDMHSAELFSARLEYYLAQHLSQAAVHADRLVNRVGSNV